MTVIFATPLVTNNPVRAQVSVDLTVTASVLPARYVIVNKNKAITKVISNTNENILPVVCLNNCNQEIIELTPSISKQYQKVIASKPNKMIGVTDISQSSHDQKLKNKEYFALGSLMRIVAVSLISSSLPVNLPSLDVT